MKRILALGVPMALVALLSGCIVNDDGVVIEGDFPVAYVQRNVSTAGNPTDGIMFSPGGDLFIMEKASASARRINITQRETQGQGDVSDPEVSYDGTRLLFAMRRHTGESWNIWEYDIQTDALRRIIPDDETANLGNDVDPHYLPDGRIVFSSDRQEKTRALMQAEEIEPYAYRDEYEREAVIALHVMDQNGQNLRQISFNQSHDRNPTVLMSGEIMYSRWDHVANRNHFPIFFTNPDGTNMFVHYGAFSPGNSFLHPREMPDGRVMSSLMPLQGTSEGGALVIIDIANYSENNHPAPGVPAGGQGQYQATPFQVPLGMDVSEHGRYTTPYPLWDGTHRALVSFTPFQPTTEVNALTGELEEVEGPPRYGIYMLDMNRQSLRPLVPPPAGKILTDPIAILPRTLPNVVPDKNLDGELANRANGFGGTGMGVLSVKSVYDTDFLDIMGNSVLVEGESIPRVDGRPDLATLRDPALTTADERPARFIRVTRAVPTPPRISMDMIGESDFEMQEILGYAQVEPDGSFRIEVPADMPLGIAVTDAEGRALQSHTNWIQVRPGETRTCNGCHSPRRAEGPLNEGLAEAGPWPNSVPLWQGHARESMAETRTRIETSVLSLMQDLVYEDVWSDETIPEVTAAPSRTIDYAGLAPDIPAPVNGIINYPDHIQPLWTRNRGSDTCVTCHTGTEGAAGLDLSNTLGGSGRLASYDALMIGPPVVDEVTGLPRVEIRNDRVVIVREPPLVQVGGAANSSRTSHLIERLFEQPLRSAYRDRVGSEEATQDHSGMLNASELRLLAEWIDIGAQYYNDPWGGQARTLDNMLGRVNGLSEDDFDPVHQVLMSSCASCHQAFGNTGYVPDLSVTNDDFRTSRYVLTGNPTGDFNITVGMVNNVCQPELSSLLYRPSSDPVEALHPGVGVNQDEPVLSSLDAEYLVIWNWINDARAANDCP
ncbi:conserved hypothetical protein [Thioalkalivibrio sulfidiphilus HL-EbGr7]|uniref:Hydrazine synthase alpha subunit middle domain-containing protein n=2 Tax=Thioalkalivibrio TaxID=106633 RepID=B8GLP5_THISH|nr:conserved hypothetical protein [Thioalkalivibrio sulfidiphilus HL-EbGr7]